MLARQFQAFSALKRLSLYPPLEMSSIAMRLFRLQRVYTSVSSDICYSPLAKGSCLCISRIFWYHSPFLAFVFALISVFGFPVHFRFCWDLHLPRFSFFSSFILVSLWLTLL
jgi:hypothetical protein